MPCLSHQNRKTKAGARGAGFASKHIYLSARAQKAKTLSALLSDH